MSLQDLHATLASFIQLERYRNNGSPSGFSFKNTPAHGFRATDHINNFELPIFDCRDFDVTCTGNSNTLPLKELPVHPDMETTFTELTGLTPLYKIKAIPTSSGRTLLSYLNNCPFYVKVAYQALLGRVTRNMTRSHVLSAIEVSLAYKEAISSGNLPDTIHIYHEHHGLYFHDLDSLQNWGYIERSITPFMKGNYIEVPAFSLFATTSQIQVPLLKNLLDLTPQLTSLESFFSYYIQPLLDLYFSSLVKLGLQPECHAQNVVFLLNNEYIPIGVALRDMESVDKDLPLIEALGYSSKYTITNYKFLFRESYNYQIKHSFMYDFKLGQYLLAPLIDTWARYYGNETSTLIDERIRIYAKKQSQALPEDFFPKSCWYDYEPIIHEGQSKRNYRKNANPRFR